MSNLKNFLIENSNINNEEHEVIVSSRFKDEKGKIMKFKIRPVSSKEFSEYQKQATKMDMLGKKKNFNVDVTKLNHLLIVNHCVEPSFRDSDLLKQLNVQTPEDAISKTLLAGEVIDLAGKLTEISGFDSDINEDIEEAKN